MQYDDWVEAFWWTCIWLSFAAVAVLAIREWLRLASEGVA